MKMRMKRREKCFEGERKSLERERERESLV